MAVCVCRYVCVCACASLHPVNMGTTEVGLSGGRASSLRCLNALRVILFLCFFLCFEVQYTRYL